jgi:signal peptidase I
MSTRPLLGQLLRRRALLRVVFGTLALACMSVFGPRAARGFYVDGASMAPTLYPGQLLLVIQAAYWRIDATPLAYTVPESTRTARRYLFGGPRRGDVVVFRSPLQGNFVVKRLIGLPGDLVRVDAGRVSVNGTILDEPYVKFGDDYSYPPDGTPRHVPDNAYFVLGDNRPVSADSHLGWEVPAEDLVGPAVWPLPQGWLPYWSMPQADPQRDPR